MGTDAISEIGDLEKLLNDPIAKPEKITFPLIQKITNRFATRIGSGGFGDVYLGLVGNKKVAVKKVKHNPEGNVEELFSCEVDCFARAKHGNVVRLVGYCADKPRELRMQVTKGINDFVEGRMRYLCLEYAPCRDLQDYIDKSQGDDWTTFYQMILGICQGLEHIHKQHIIHLDLKPKNILLDAYMRTKITDFGSSKYLTKGESTAIVERLVGTEGFMAPEMGTSKEISCKTDVYALGATVACLLGWKNRKDENVKQWLEKNPADEKCPKEKKMFIDIVGRCIQEPNKRITLEEIMVQLKEMGLNDLTTYDSEEVIKVVPHKMQFPAFDPENAVSSTLNLVNRTGQYVACMISQGKNGGTEYRREIIGPRSTHTIDMPREASETFRVRSTVVTKLFEKADIPADLFKMEVPGRRTYQVDVHVVVEARHQGNTSLEGSTRPLSVQPSEVQIPFEPNKCMPFMLHLTNSTDRVLGFTIRIRGHQWPSDHFLRDDILRGFVPPRSSSSFVMVARSQQKITDDASKVANGMIVSSGICDDTSIQQKRRMNFDSGDRVKVEAVYTLPGEITYEPSPHGMKIISTILYPSGLTSVDANPREPWIVMTERSGYAVRITNYDTQQPAVHSNVKVQFRGMSPKFIAQREWIMVPSRDDGYIDTYDYKMGKIGISIKGSSSNKVRNLAVHPTKLSVLSICSREREIKLWEWDKDWKLTRTFVTEVVTDDINQVVFDPKNTNNSFASGWNDGTIKFWDLDSSQCRHILSGHADKVYCLDFFTREDQQQYLISGSEDNTAKIWDIQKLTLVHTLQAFMYPVICVFGHPNLPLLITGTENGIVHVWSSTDFGVKSIFDMGYGGNILSLALACPMGSNRVVIGQATAVSILDLGDKSDIKKEGQRQLETMEFGEPNVSSLPVSLEHRRRPEKNNSLVWVQEPVVSQSSSGSSSVATSSVAAVLETSNSVPVIDQIEQLLSKVEQLAQKVPTTGERLGISRTHQRAEAIHEATDNDVDVLESLKQATVDIRNRFVKLGKKQDATCRKYERMAALAKSAKIRLDTLLAKKARLVKASGDC